MRFTSSFRQVCDLILHNIKLIRRRASSGKRVNLLLVKELRRRIAEALPATRCRLIDEVLRQLDNYLSKPRSRLACIELSRGDFILLVGFIRPSKAEDAFFECAVLHRKCLPTIVPSSFPSIAVPVQLVAGTSGLLDEEMFGIFAEHFGYGLPRQQFWKSARAYYLTDRFERRFLEVTSVCVDTLTTSESLPSLKNWKPSVRDSVGVQQAASWWLALHEHFHGTGDLPFHRFMCVKDNRLSAGFEELRVDLISILQLLELDIPERRAFAEYVLAERLMTYPIIDLKHCERAKMTFDSVGSHVLCLKLLELGAAEVVDGRLRISACWPVAVKSIVGEFQSLESRIIESPSSERRGELLHFVKQTVKECAPDAPRHRRLGDQVPMLQFFSDGIERLGSVQK